VTSAPPPSAELLERIARLTPVRTRRPHLQFTMLLALCVVWGAAVVLLGNGVRRDLRGVAIGEWLLVAIWFAAWLVAQLAWSVVPPRGQVLPRGDRASTLALVLALAAAAVGAAVGLDDPERSIHPPPGEFWSHATSCALSGLLLAAGPALLTLWAMRRLAPVGAWRLGVSAGGASGALAGLALHVQCAVVDPLHVGLAHGAVVLIPLLIVGIIFEQIVSRG
jgi:hypothetical protein